VRAHLAVSYGAGSINAISSISGVGLQLDLTEAGNLHHMFRAGVATDLQGLATMPIIAPRDNDKGLFVITMGASLRVYSTYTEFQQALATVLDGAMSVISVHTHSL